MATKGQSLNTIGTTVLLDELAEWIRQDIALTRLVREEWDANPHTNRRSPERKGRSRAIWSHGANLARQSGIADPTYDQCWDACLAYSLGYSVHNIHAWKRKERY